MVMPPWGRQSYPSGGRDWNRATRLSLREQLLKAGLVSEQQVKRGPIRLIPRLFTAAP
jgi:hypothetical protein